MQCHNCGYDNPLTNSFCAKCASHLSTNIKLVRARQVFVLPQEELASQIQPRSIKPKPRQLSGLAVGLIVGLILLLLIVYGFIFL